MKFIKRFITNAVSIVKEDWPYYKEQGLLPVMIMSCCSIIMSAIAIILNIIKIYPKILELLSK